MKELLDICNGKSPSRLFRELMASDQSLNKSDIAGMFYNTFENVDSVVIQMIWHWKYDDESLSITNDDQLDAMLRQALSQAGYLHR
jgi:hypothetical protein